MPIYFVRYEELVDDPYETMVDVFSYILGISKESVNSTIIGERLRTIVDEELLNIEESKFSPNKTSSDKNKTKGKYNKSFDSFTDSQIY